MKAIRVIIIVQLCIAFTILAANASFPYLEELFAIKSRTVLYRHVVTNEHFKNLSSSEQSKLLGSYRKLQERLDTPFITKLGQSLSILAFGIPPLKQAWIAFAIVISILLLLGKEGALLAAWLLPAIALLYSITSEHVAGPSADQILFPSEEVIVNDYLKHPLSTSIGQQEEELRRGWKLYVIREWGHEIPSSDPEQFSKQASKGEFAFTITRLQLLEKQPLATIPDKVESRLSLIIYILWNGFFAWFVNRQKAWACNKYAPIPAK